MREVTGGQKFVGMFGVPIPNHKPAGSPGKQLLENSAGPNVYGVENSELSLGVGLP